MDLVLTPPPSKTFRIVKKDKTSFNKPTETSHLSSLREAFKERAKKKSDVDKIISEQRREAEENLRKVQMREVSQSPIAKAMQTRRETMRLDGSFIAGVELTETDDF